MQLTTSVTNRASRPDIEDIRERVHNLARELREIRLRIQESSKAFDTGREAEVHAYELEVSRLVEEHGEEVQGGRTSLFEDMRRMEETREARFARIARAVNGLRDRLETELREERQRTTAEIAAAQEALRADEERSRDPLDRGCVAPGADCVAAARGREVWPPALRAKGDQDILDDPRAAIAVRLGRHEPDPRSKEMVEEKIPLDIGILGPFAAQDQDAFGPDGAGRRRRGAAVVRLDAAAGDDGIGAGAPHLGEMELELADLVARPGEPGEIVAFHPEIDAEPVGKPGKTFERRRKARERDSGRIVDHEGSFRAIVSARRKATGADIGRQPARDGSPERHNTRTARRAEALPRGPDSSVCVSTSADGAAEPPARRSRSRPSFPARERRPRASQQSSPKAT